MPFLSLTIVGTAAMGPSGERPVLLIARISTNLHDAVLLVRLEDDPAQKLVAPVPAQGTDVLEPLQVLIDDRLVQGPHGFVGCLLLCQAIGGDPVLRIAQDSYGLLGNLQWLLNVFGIARDANVEDAVRQAPH